MSDEELRELEDELESANEMVVSMTVARSLAAEYRDKLFIRQRDELLRRHREATA